MNIPIGEVVEKLKAYEEIKAGDEVIYNNTIICAVLTPETDNRYASIVDGCGKHYFADHRELKKTGKHYDHIEQLLAEMRVAEPKTGKWKNIVEGIEYACGTCDTCGMRIPMAYKYYEYCPHCGMKNEVEHDE